MHKRPKLRIPNSSKPKPQTPRSRIKPQSPTPSTVALRLLSHSPLIINHSSLTNHKNTKNGVIKGGFDRVNLFQQAEQGFDKLFGYDHQYTLSPPEEITE